MRQQKNEPDLPHIYILIISYQQDLLTSTTTTIQARQGNADAQATLGLAYWTGLGVEESAASAVAWWSKAAKQKHPAAQTSLGVAYMIGKGVAKPKPASALKHWKRAAAAGDVMALTNLGICYMNGEGGREEVAFTVLALRLLHARDVRARRRDLRGEPRSPRGPVQVRRRR